MNYAAQFQQLDTLLAEHRELWQIRPFHLREMPWLASGLVAALDTLEQKSLQHLQSNPSALADWLKPWVPQSEKLLALCDVPLLKSTPLNVPGRSDYAVPGRKWQQIMAFAGALSPSQEPLLEWCAGKGHLGRLLGQLYGQTVTALEWQKTLCVEGEKLAQRADVDMQFAHCDALSSAAAVYLSPKTHAVALHACGDLHTQLIRHWVARGSTALAIAPCCYHLTRHSHYCTLSKSAASSSLVLQRADLKIPLQETVTARASTQALSEKEVLWRLAFDAWQREQRGIDDYLPLPTIPHRVLLAGFTDFIDWAAATKNLPCETNLHEEKYLERARHRYGRVQRMELVQHLFRRPLEMWLVLDLAVYLQEQGADVIVGEFCQRQLTPRNLLIQARR